jgi:hypothetical protein
VRRTSTTRSHWLPPASILSLHVAPARQSRHQSK